MTTPPPGEAGWEQRLENLARAQERVDGLREQVALFGDAHMLDPWMMRCSCGASCGRPGTPRHAAHLADALITGPLAPLLEAQAEGAHGPGKCVSVEDANRVLAQERAGVQALIADAEKRAAARALREAADEGRYMMGMPEVVQGWQLRDRAAALDPT